MLRSTPLVKNHNTPRGILSGDFLIFKENCLSALPQSTYKAAFGQRQKALSNEDFDVALTTKLVGRQLI
ncbi:hypothetical protein AMTR_s00170p00026150 [Amborella trichopoda]|uniref:Uncharacterized protein n=1 Tax=Amborella trichopoda TaxID=13333 RepID=W1NRX2_AMBTC|nr:hypothetical protein AMTR_s00170p00026150 [Amborella trichopoda]